ncbi:MAG: DUF692 domain-containing protein [Pseudomonadota bacterium]
MQEETTALYRDVSPSIGVGLRHPHYQDALDNKPEEVDFLEVHAENFFASGGIIRALLDDVCDQYAISVHGTSLGLGSEVPLPERVLTQFSELVAHTNPMLVSEHLCFNRAMIDGQLKHSGDLLPIPYNDNSLKIVEGQIQRVQDRIKRPLLIENLSAYIHPNELVPNTNDHYSEIEFLNVMCERAGCGLLLDLNNLLVNAHNRDVEDPVTHVLDTLERLSDNHVGEIHLAGFNKRKVHGYYVDDHGAAVSDQCWQLYRELQTRFHHVPTLVEWDTQIPSWEVLTDQAKHAHTIAITHNPTECSS